MSVRLLGECTINATQTDSRKIRCKTILTTVRFECRSSMIKYIKFMPCGLLYQSVNHNLVFQYYALSNEEWN